MFLTMFLLFALYVAFVGVMAVFFTSRLFPILVVMTLFLGAQFLFSDRIALYSMGASEVSEGEYPELHATVSRLAQQADLPKPTVAFLIVRWGWLFAGGRDRGNGAPVIVAIIASLVVWVISFLLIRALSRYREYAADRGGAVITGKPSALASALVKIDGTMDQVPEDDLRDQAEMNAFFVIPIRSGIVGRLFSTHPSTEQRVEKLRELERELETR